MALRAMSMGDFSLYVALGFSDSALAASAAFSDFFSS